MGRVTFKHLMDRVSRLRSAGYDINLGAAYGGYSILNAQGNRNFTGGHDEANHVNEFLNGFETGAGQGWDRCANEFSRYKIGDKIVIYNPIKEHGRFLCLESVVVWVSYDLSSKKFNYTLSDVAHYKFDESELKDTHTPKVGDYVQLQPTREDHTTVAGYRKMCDDGITFVVCDINGDDVLVQREPALDTPELRAWREVRID